MTPARILITANGGRREGERSSPDSGDPPDLPAGHDTGSTVAAKSSGLMGIARNEAGVWAGAEGGDEFESGGGWLGAMILAFGPRRRPAPPPLSWPPGSY